MRKNDIQKKRDAKKAVDSWLPFASVAMITKHADLARSLPSLLRAFSFSSVNVLMFHFSDAQLAMKWAFLWAR